MEIGQVLDGKYRVTALIGEGGMGAVYAGVHLRLHRKVAIKVLHATVAHDAEIVGRFEREAQAAGRIGNDHILEVLDIGELPSGERFIVMEFLEGESLAARLTRMKRATPRQILPLVRQLLEGLAAAHAAGIVHRDLKPANVFVLREKAGQPDYVKIIDFGISKFQGAAETNHQQTRTGTVIGTPSYMSPEQARGLREADARSDLYAVGVILYEAVSGRLPFEGVSTTDLLFKIYLNEPTPIESLAPDVDPAFCTIIMRALAKDPNDRFARAEHFIAALDAWAQTRRGVSVAKSGAAVPATMAYEGPAVSAPEQVRPAPPPVSPVASTQGSWAESQQRRAKSGSKAVVLAFVTVAVLAAGGVGAMLFGRAQHDGETAPKNHPPPTVEAIPMPGVTVAPAAHEAAPVAATEPQAPAVADAGIAVATPPPAHSPERPRPTRAMPKEGHAAPSAPPAAPKRTADPLEQL